MADDIIASAKSMTSISENQHVTVGMPANALTPATLTAMTGIAKGGALQLNPSITAAIGKIQSHVSSLFSGGGGNAAILSAAGVSFSTPSTDIAGDISKVTSAAANAGVTLSPSVTSSMSSAMTASSALQTQASQIMAAGPAGFGKILNQVTAHVNEAIDIKKATNFMANTSYGDYGDGITDMASLTTQGLNGSIGNMKAVGAAFASAGPMFDLTDMKNFGSPVGMINKLTSARMGNSTGINSLLAKAGVDTNNLSDPTQADKINKVFSSVNDPKVIATVADQFGVATKNNPFAGLPSAGDDNSLSGGASLLGGR
jgi:hypothetical protein